MFHTPAHKQTNPAALPAQIVNPLRPTERDARLAHIQATIRSLHAQPKVGA